VVCYKSGSAPKLLIFKDIPSGKIFASRGQALDFSGTAARPQAAFNKVIHNSAHAFANVCQIKDLAAIRKAHPQLSRPSGR
jgi:hypothetical protein